MQAVMPEIPDKATGIIADRADVTCPCFFAYTIVGYEGRKEKAIWKTIFLN